MVIGLGTAPPPRRLLSPVPTLLSTERVPPGKMEMAPVPPTLPAPAPTEPPRASVPAFTVMVAIVPGLATASVVVPLPILVIAVIAVPRAVVSTLIVPAPANVTGCAPPMAPRIFSVAVESAPIVAAPPSVMKPLVVLVVPARACRAPPVLMPVPTMFNWSQIETPESWSAPPVAATTVFPTVDDVLMPKAPAFVTLTAPAAMESWPAQMPLSALSTRVPGSALVNPLLAKPKAELRVKVVLPATSMTLLATAVLLKVIWRPALSEMESGLAAVPPKARMPEFAAPALRNRSLAVSPRAASLLKASMPPVMAMLETKLLVALFNTTTPVPALVQTPPVGEPVTWPLRVRPCTTLDAVNVPTLIVVRFLSSVVVPVNSKP